MIGMTGPEFQSILRSPTLYEKILMFCIDLKIEYDIWTWQRCLFTENSPWIVYNINKYHFT